MSDAAGPAREALLAVARFASVFSAPGFSAGRWASGPYFQACAAVHDFVHAVYDHGLVLRDFDWSEWAPIGAQVEADPEKVAKADLDTLRRLLTVHVRMDRFVEGHLASAIGNGQIGRVLTRLAVLATGEASAS